MRLKWRLSHFEYEHVRALQEPHAGRRPVKSISELGLSNLLLAQCPGSFIISKIYFEAIRERGRPVS